MKLLKSGALPDTHGGARPGAGRKPSEFVEKCRHACTNPKFFEWANKALSGEPTEVKVLSNGESVAVPATAMEKKSLHEHLAAYGFGKPVQAVELSGDVAVSFGSLLGKAESERGLG